MNHLVLEKSFNFWISNHSQLQSRELELGFQASLVTWTYDIFKTIMAINTLKDILLY